VGGTERWKCGKEEIIDEIYTVHPLFSQRVDLCIFIILGNVPVVSKRYVILLGHVIDIPVFFPYINVLSNSS